MGPELQHFLLIMIRISIFIIVCPAFSIKGMPNLMKAGLTIGLSLAVYPNIQLTDGTLPLLTFTVWAIKEMILGFTFGYITQLFFTAIEMAGHFVDFQVGFSMGEIYDPNLGISVSNYGRVYYWLSVCIFFMTNLHHHLLRGLVQSFQLIPISQTQFTYIGTEGILQLFGHVFGIALQLALPLMMVALLSEIVLALLSRTVPQINVLILGMPLKILLSLIFFFLFLGPLIRNIGDVLPEMVQYVNEWMHSIAGW